MPEAITRGGNYSIERDGDICRCVVWVRPDLDTEAGASLAVEKVTWFRKLAQGDAAGMVFDLSKAPPVAGPKTQAAIGKMVAAWESAGKRIAVVIGASPMQRMQLERVIAESAPRMGRLVLTPTLGFAWVRSATRLKSP